MGQQNVARDIFSDFTTREVTPYLQTQITDATDRALQNVNNLYASAGRTGSAAFADAAARVGPPRPHLSAARSADRRSAPATGRKHVGAGVQSRPR